MSFQQEEQINITGMTCASCAASIEAETRKIEGVEKASVNFSTEKGYFSFSSPSAQEEVHRKIKALGYDTAVSDQLSSTAEITHDLVRFVVSFLLALFIFSLEMGPLAQWPNPQINWILQFVAAFPIWLWIGWRFQRAMIAFFLSGHSNMNTLIGLGTTAAFLYSSFVVWFPNIAQSIGLEIRVYFEAVGFIISFVFLGQFLEHKAKKKTKAALEALLNVQAKKASLITDDGEKSVPIEAVQRGDLLRVRPGEKIPVDGEVQKGSTEVDEAMLTGEPELVKKGPGSDVFAGTINQGGTVSLRARKVGGETFLSQVIQYVEKAQAAKPPIQKYADRISGLFVPAVIAMALVTLGAWLYWADWGMAVSSMIAVLVIACPCALGLATPTAIVVATGQASREGILISGGDVVESASHIDMVVFDKTGTLTAGRPQVVDATFFASNERQLTEDIVAIESYSEHSLARALVAHFTSQGVQAQAEPDEFEVAVGRGVRATIENRTYLIGSLAFMEKEQVSFPKDFTDKVARAASTHAYVACNNELVGVISIDDPLRPESSSILERLREQGIKTCLMTGDNEATAQRVASALSIEKYYAGVLPVEKARYIEDLKKSGLKVAMVGDGINDAPALAVADLSVAMGTGTDVAMSTADVTLVRGDLKKLLIFLNLSQNTMRTIRQNLFLSLIYNSLCIPIAAGLFYPIWGWKFPPSLAGLAMGLSSVSVVLNSLRLKRKAHFESSSKRSSSSGQSSSSSS